MTTIRRLIENMILITKNIIDDDRDYYVGVYISI